MDSSGILLGFPMDCQSIFSAPQFGIYYEDALLRILQWIPLADLQRRVILREIS